MTARAEIAEHPDLRELASLELSGVGPARFVFVTGGVCSSLGKGIAAASLGRLLKARGLKVAALKMDPYLSVDTGVMAPSEHGEVFVTFDAGRRAAGAQLTYGETDLDLGHYERFIDVELPAASSVSSGQVYSAVIAAERRGDFLGATVQTVPHIVDEIARRITFAAEGQDVLIVEVGGTVGDMEITPFLEAIRRMRTELGPYRTASVHLALVPEVGPNRELKTKPAQHSVSLLRSFGINPDVLLARACRPIGDASVLKLTRLCGLPAGRVLSAADVPSIYAVPAALSAQGFDEEICAILGLATPPADLTSWDAAVANLIAPPPTTVRVGIVAKYTDGADTYISVCEALRHAAAAHDATAELVWIDASDDDVVAQLAAVDAVVVPGGFGSRGVEGKVAAAGHCRRNGLPYLGLCLGLQVAVVEFARNVAGIDGACSLEWGTMGPQVVALLDSQQGVDQLGGTMRLGAYEAVLAPGTRTAAAYGVPAGGTVSERHRHRFEVNPAFVPTLQAAGLVVAGTSPDGTLVEHIELTGHPCFLATQAHPEFLSRPGRPHPLFDELVRSALDRHRALPAAP